MNADFDYIIREKFSTHGVTQGMGNERFEPKGPLPWIKRPSLALKMPNDDVPPPPLDLVVNVYKPQSS